MNRLIKFRQAHFDSNKNFQRFSYWETINHIGESSLDGAAFVSPIQGPYEIKWHQQYTGLKDKNGVEIYESDFVKISMGFAERICEVIFRNGGFIVESDGFFGSEESDISLIGWAIDEMDSIEVIGNIYSNPELIKHT